MHNTDRHFSTENKGIDGFTMEKLLHNIDDWITTYDPDIVTVLIGINDIGIMINTRRTPQQQQILMKEFSERYEILACKLSAIQRTVPSTSTRKLFFLEPFIFHGRSVTHPGFLSSHKCPVRSGRSARSMEPFLSRCRMI